jgi:frataxin-like iron-binding protein CyaY
MALKKREKTLAVITVALVVPVVGWYLVSAWRGPLSTLGAQRDDLREEVDRKKEQVKRGRKAQAQLADWNRRSLPPDSNAQSLYQDWLLGLGKDIGFRGTTVDVTPGGRSRDGVFLKPRFTVKAGATLSVLAKFLHRFESADYLHQIRSLTIKTTKGSSDLGLTIVVEALSLPEAKPDPGVTVDVATGTFDTVTRLTSDLKAALVHTGRDGKLVDKAAFSFAGAKGTFAFKAGQTLDEVRDEINKKTDETGVVARVDDDNLSLEIKTAASDPPESLEAIAARNLFAPYKAPPPPPPTPSEEPAPPEPPKFDPGKYAYVSAILATNGQPKVWVNARASGETFKLREGETFDVGDVHAKILRVSRPDSRGRHYPRYAEIEFDGKPWRVYMGDNLREASPLFDEEPEPSSDEEGEPAPEMAAEPPAEDEETPPAEQPAEPASDEDAKPPTETAAEPPAEEKAEPPAEEAEPDAEPAAEEETESAAEEAAEEESEPATEAAAEPLADESGR